MTSRSFSSSPCALSLSAHFGTEASNPWGAYCEMSVVVSAARSELICAWLLSPGVAAFPDSTGPGVPSSVSADVRDTSRHGAPSPHACSCSLYYVATPFGLCVRSWNSSGWCRHSKCHSKIARMPRPIYRMTVENWVASTVRAGCHC